MSFLTQIEEQPQGFTAWKYTHSKENFMENKILSYKIFAKCITLWEIIEWI